MASTSAPRLWDISQPLRPSLPVWPGDTAFSSRRRWIMEDGSPVNVASFEASTHAGTHADAPLHYDPAGAAADETDLSFYLGPCRVVDARACGQTITCAFIADLAGLAAPPPRVLFRTYEIFPHQAWRSDFTAVAPDAIAWLAERGVRLIGVDAPSLDPEDSKTMDAHRAVLAADMRILEGLVLDEVPPGDYELLALPLNLAGLDSSPVRAVLRELGA
jgi:arylformamidase